jgi:Ca2+-binding RTX toxin-like protein
MTELVFQARDINAMGIAGPGAAAIVWDDLVARVDWSMRLTEDSFGISIPVVSAGATAYVKAALGVEVTLAYDAGSFGVDYRVSDNADGFTEWRNEQATPYDPPPSDPDQTNLAHYRNANPILQPGLTFVSGDLPFTAPTGPSTFSIDFVYGLQAGVNDIDLSLDLWFDEIDLISNGAVVLADIPEGRDNIFSISTGQDYTPEPTTYPINVTILKVPEPISDFGAIMVGEGDLPSLMKDGAGGTFFQATFSMAAFLANLFPAFKVLKGEYQLAGPDTVLYWTLLDVEANVMVHLVQEVEFDLQGVRVQVDTNKGQHLEGLLGDSFELETPEGQGRLEADVLYTPYGTYSTRIGVVVSANIEVSAFQIGLRNTAFKDFNVSVGPLVHFFIPDQTGWAAEPIWLYENSREVVLDGADTADGVTGTRAHYTAWYENDVTASDGPDNKQLTDNQAIYDALAGNDSIAGSFNHNTIFGNRDNDTLHGLGGADFLSGGQGNDRLFGDAGPGLPATSLTGGNAPPTIEGDDVLVGGPGDDSLYGQGGRDLLAGGDLSSGPSGSDMLNGGAGNDTLYGGPADGGADTLDGGTGWDRVVLRRAGMQESVYIAAGTNVTLPGGTRLLNFDELHFASGFGRDALIGGLGADSLHGGAGNDSLVGNRGADTLQGGAGDDTIVCFDDADTAKADRLDGGSGNDLLRFIGQGGNNDDNVIILDADIAFAYGTTALNFERIDFLSGNTTGGRDVVAGGDGDDSIFSLGGNDLIGGGYGRNVLFAGAGNDVIASIGQDYVDGGTGDDLLIMVARTSGRLGFGASSQFVFRAGESQILSNNTQVVNIERLDWTGNGAADFVTGGVNRDALMGGGGADTLDGGGERDTIDGGSGDDVIIARRGEGADTLEGGEGDDRLVLDLGDAMGGIYHYGWWGVLDARYLFGPTGTTMVSGFERVTIRAGQGNDILDGGEAETSNTAPRGSPLGFGDRLYGGAGNDILNGLGGRDALYGEEGDDQLVWSLGADVIDGGTGMDLLWIDAGLGAPLTILIAPLDVDDGDPLTTENETLLSDGTRIANVEHLRYIGTGASGPVRVVAGIFSDTLQGSFYADTLEGGRGGDSIDGGAGFDSILGGEGADTLRGGAGADRLEGGADRDHLTAGGGFVDTGGGGGAGGGGGVGPFAGFATSLPGGGGVDTFPGFATDSLWGGEGADTLVADVDAHADGGADIDTLVVTRNGSMISMAIDITDPAMTTPLGFLGSVRDVEILRFQGGEAADDIAVAGLRAHDLRGNGGLDRLLVDLSAESLASPLSVNTAGLFSFGAGRAQGFEQVTLLLGGGADRFLPGQASNVAWTVQAGAGADTIAGGARGDSLDGGIGNDRIDGHGGADTLSGFIGRDTLRGGDGDDLILGAGLEAGELYDAGAGIDIFSMAGDAVAVLLDLAATQASRAGANAVMRFFEAIEGGAGADTLFGAGGAETLLGGEGNDRLDGRSGADSMAGGAGNDRYVVDNIDDRVVEGANRGQDQVQATVSHVLAANVEDLLLLGTAARGTGNTLDNFITGNLLDNRLGGREGADTLRGAEGADTLEGGAGGDRLEGGDGADSLIGGTGADTLFGGAGNDIFRLDDSLSVDWIRDFTEGDRIHLVRAAIDPLGAHGVTAGALTETHFGYRGSGWQLAIIGRDLIFDGDGLAGSGDEVTLATLFGARPALGDFTLI